VRVRVRVRAHVYIDAVLPSHTHTFDHMTSFSACMCVMLIGIKPFDCVVVDSIKMQLYITSESS